MTDIGFTSQGIAPRRTDTRSVAAKARLKARYRSNTRFRWYGISALAIASAFLVILITDIFTKGMPAFWQHSIVADVAVTEDIVDPDGKRDPSAILGADYMALARTALAAAVPGIEGRTQKKQLNDLLSSGAADELRTEVAAHPEMIGKTVKANFLLSDTADLYLKGDGTPIINSAPSLGTATPSATAGEITVLTTDTDFAAALVEVKKDIQSKAAALSAEADRLQRLNSGTTADRIAELRKDAKSLEARLSNPNSEEVLDGKIASHLVEINGGLVKVTKLASSVVTGDVLIPLKSTEAAAPGQWQLITYATPETDRSISDRGVAFLEHLRSNGHVEKQFNWRFFTAGDSREAELAGVRGAIVGSLLTLFVTMIICLPIGVLAAIYLEQFAPKNRLTDLIDININNLAAVPSIVFGLLGLAVFLNFFGLPRSAPLVGGLVLALLVLPTIIITSRAALRAVPPSVQEAALGIGASKQQAIFHHVLPLAMPGIMTGTIIGMAHALGETAPLLMIGMVAFIVDVPKGFTESATVLPVQIYLWSDLPEPAFQSKTAAAIIVLLTVLFVMNGAAIWLRKKFERRW